MAPDHAAGSAGEARPGAEEVSAGPPNLPTGEGARDGWDVAVVGAGIVGLAVARELGRRSPGLRVLVLDREQRIGAHQTGHNSGVAHAGIYYQPGSLKARLCRKGIRLLYDYCEQHGIAHERCGKLIVATDESELGALAELERRARANGVPGIRRVSAAEIAEIEPHTTGVEGFHSPETGIVDFPAVARALADELTASGGQVALGREVVGSRREHRGITLATAQGEEFHARYAIYCAGLWSDRLAVRDGAPADPRILPFRGAYLRLRPAARHLVRSIIYPVPDPRLPFLGVHLTRHISGDILLGPTALLAGALDAYSLRRIRPADLARTLAWPGTWRMAARFWRTGIEEMRMAASVRRFVAACARYVPALQPHDVERAYAGVRAQAVARDGSLVDDFVVSQAERAIHVRNAPSPAATSSLALAELITDRALEAFGLPRTPASSPPAA